MDHFLSQILMVIHQIPYGKVSTYGDIANMAGFPGYARHVGRALANLPPGSTLPWYRVINSRGMISLKGEDLQRQQALLASEGVKVNSAGKLSLKQYRWHP